MGNVKKMAFASILCALAVVGSMFYVPVLGSQCAPVQHIVNVICAVILGPVYGVGVAFVASLLRNLLGLGTLMAFPGSMIGVLLSGLIYQKWKKISLAALGEVVGTSILGGLCAWPIAILFLGKSAGEVAFYAYIVPFLISTVAGSALAWLFLVILQKAKVLQALQRSRQ